MSQNCGSIVLLFHGSLLDFIAEILAHLRYCMYRVSLPDRVLPVSNAPILCDIRLNLSRNLFSVQQSHNYCPSSHTTGRFPFVTIVA